MEICEKNKCTGCSACAQICPKQCITMQPDNEGFLRPVIEEKQCVKCEKCQKACPVNHPTEDDGALPKVFAAKHLDEAVRSASSSGGAFSALAERILMNGGVVIAAGFDEKLGVIHKVCTHRESLDELRRSKYVQSDIHGTFREAKMRLEQGQEVLFCGTPCQIGGLLAFIGNSHPNLYTVDFICHGVPSPKLWRNYLQFREMKANAKAKNVSFRCKVVGWRNYSLKVEFRNGAEYCGTVREDMYLRSFIMNLDLRPSCNQCAFKQVHRQSDITLADFWSIEKVNPILADDKGVSAVFAHSAKGERLLTDIQNTLTLVPVDPVEAIRENPAMTKSTSKPALRDRFMEQADHLDFEKLHNRYCGTGFSSKVRRKTAAILSKIKRV